MVAWLPDRIFGSPQDGRRRNNRSRIRPYRQAPRLQSLCRYRSLAPAPPLSWSSTWPTAVPYGSRVRWIPACSRPRSRRQGSSAVPGREDADVPPTPCHRAGVSLKCDAVYVYDRRRPNDPESSSRQADDIARSFLVVVAPGNDPGKPVPCRGQMAGLGPGPNRRAIGGGPAPADEGVGEDLHSRRGGGCGPSTARTFSRAGLPLQ